MDGRSSTTCRTILLAVGVAVAVWGVVGLFGIREGVLSGVLEGLVTLAFVGAGLWALFLMQTSGACLLAILGVSYGVVNFDGPIPGLLEGTAGFVRGHLGLFYVAVLLHFLMVVPRPKQVLRRRAAVWLLYLPFLIFLAFGVVDQLSPAVHDQYMTTQWVIDLLYMALALVALGHSWFSLSRSERRASGFYWIPLGLVVAIGPFIVLALGGMVMPEFSMPGQAYMALLGVAIPIGMALAVVRGAWSSPA